MYAYYTRNSFVWSRVLNYIKTKKLNVLKYHWSLIEEPNRTIHNTGEKTIKIRTTGNEKNRVIVVSACAGDASKLRPMVIFKRKTLPKLANKHGVVIAAQEKGWMDTEGMKLWIDKVWHARRGGLERRRSLLVFDSFEAHVTDRVKRALERETRAWL